MDELRNRAVCYDIIGVTENWGNNEIYDAELQIPGYHMFRVDRRTTTRGGGVILYVSKGAFQWASRPPTGDPFPMERIWVTNR